MDTTRLAALKLATMHETDRQWIIEQLDTKQQQQIKILLQELSHLNLENIQLIYDDLISNHTTIAKNSSYQSVDSHSKEVTLFDEWNILNHVQLTARLDRLPEALRLSVIASYRWPWLDYAIDYYQAEEKIDKTKILTIPNVLNMLLTISQAYYLK